jgi:exopolysaccharide biosynthesis polyprenyl glycosylphosphotransferase
MKNNNSIAYNDILVLGDFVALAAAFVVSYILRVSVSHVPLSEHVTAATYISIVLSILPFWILIFALLGLYQSRHYDNRFSEFGRLLVGCVTGVMAAISYAYVANVQIFPARLVVLYGLLLAFLFVLLFRTLIRGFRRFLFARGKGLNRVLVVGDSRLTPRLVSAISASQRTQGDFVIGVVGGSKHVIEPNTGFLVFSTFDDAVEALKKNLPNTIIQTELYGSNEQNNAVLAFAQQHHIDYRFVPGASELYVGNIEVELFHSIPMVAVHQTALVGWGRVVKRGFDIIFSLLAILISSPVMLVTAILIKLMSGGGSVFFRQARLTRANRVFKVYKFRSQYAQYDGTTPEQAFAKLGKPELAEQYRSNGDKLDDDPRITPIGRFIRRYSIDELPQLFNVLRGDISMVGPRALVPEELARYSRKHTILSVRSGLTGLAQVSGRRDISFDERRKLDIYYVQNWSFRGDLIILIRTVWIVLFHRGAE